MAAELIVGGLVGAVIGELLSAVLEAKDKALMFRSTLEHMEETLQSIVPIVENIEELDKRLDRRKEETGKLVEIIKKGKILVLDCTKLRWYHYCWKRPRYTDKLLELEASLKSFFDIDVQAQLARDTREILLLARNEKRLNCVDGFNVLCAVPEAPINPVGLEVPLEELKMELFKDEVTMVVLSAPPGYGKTTLAKLLCHDKQVEEKFKDNIFYVIVSKNTTLEGIVQRLFKHKGHNVDDFHSDDYMVNRLGQFFKTIGTNPILLVLDDVWPESESLLEKFKFQIKDYKILVTSRSVFPRFGSTYKLQPLNNEDSMTLFCASAFLPDGSSYKPDQDIVKKIVESLKGHPLAISVIGRSLRGKPAPEWRKRLKDCSKTASILTEDELLKCLKSSVDALDDKVVAKECYMDLGSFPQDQMIPATTLIDMWVELHNIDEDDAMANLYELTYRNLVDLVVTRKDASEEDGTYNEHFVVQQGLLRELAIRQGNLGRIEQRERLFIDIIGNKIPEWWREKLQPFKSTKLLSISTDETFSSSWGTMQAAEVEVLVLNFQTTNYTLPEFMGTMDKLKVLIVSNNGLYPAEFSNCPLFGSLSNLKRIRLEKISIPSLFLASVQLKKLEKMSLVMCNVGQAFSNFNIKISDAFPNLVEIEIDYCDDLVELPAGFCDLVLLERLSITNCHKLSTLPEQIEKLVHLQVLRLNSCIELLGLPDTIGRLHELKILDLSNCFSIAELPKQIGDLYNLRKLYMIECSSCELTSSIINLVNLKEVIGDEETASSWKYFKPYLPSLTIKVHKEIHLNWLR